MFFPIISFPETTRPICLLPSLLNIRFLATEIFPVIFRFTSFFATFLVVKGWSVSSDGWKTAQGYKMTIIRYSYETKTEEELASILLYSSGLVADINIDLPVGFF